MSRRAAKNAAFRRRYATSAEFREQCSDRNREQYQKHRIRRMRAQRLWYAKSGLECSRARSKVLRERYVLLHLQAIAKLGNVCKVCGFSDARALQIDHVNGGSGREENNGRRYYQRVIDDTSGRFQLLCSNHNLIKAHEEGKIGAVRRKHA
ncbi:hypothetical protein LCGC14_1429800 [marine sediment metagenome]|uniref:HNH nuclease domain-containing protein n=1 Tax=marine sediment metagenome TaxID=412755 RepID=A0A0F9M4F1_9ZZZZ